MATFLRSIKWSAFAEIASKTITPIILLVLARLLTPEDFGVVTAATMVVTFSQIFWEAGMSKALIQRQADVVDAANAAFFVNLGLGAVITALVYFTAPAIAHIFFQDGRVSAVLQVMAVQISLGALSSVHIALLQKEMRFERLFWVRLATVVIPGAASIPLALNGFGYWALVVGTLAGQIAQVTMLWRMSAWRPRCSLNYSVTLEITRFGAWVALSGLLAWLVAWLDTLIVGKYLGPHELGIYRVGNQFATMIFALIFAPIVPVLYSRLTRMKEDSASLAYALQKVIKLITLTSVPLATVLFSYSPQIGAIVLGPQWEGVDLVLGVLALVHGASWIVGMNGEAYRACGKPSLETLVAAISLAFYLPVYVYTIQMGVEVFLWSRLALALCALILHLLLLRFALNIPSAPILGSLATVGLISLITVRSVEHVVTAYITSVWWQLSVGGLVTFVILGAVIWFTERNGAVKDLLTLIKSNRDVAGES